jgi:hypothetical protein
VPCRGVKVMLLAQLLYIGYECFWRGSPPVQYKVPRFIFFSIVNKVTEVNLFQLPVLPFDELPTSYKCIISSFTLKSRLFHFIVINKVFQHLAVAGK